jgi:hypothetical protein
MIPGQVDPPGATIYHFPVAEKTKLHDVSATDEEGATPLSSSAITVVETKEATRGFLQVGRRNLSEEELSTPAARRFLIFEIERLDQSCSENVGFIEKYHDQRVTIASLTEAGKKSRWNEILSFICLSVGSAGLGAAPSYFAIPGAIIAGTVVFGLSVILVGTGIASRVWK